MDSAAGGAQEPHACQAGGNIGSEGLSGACKATVLGTVNLSFLGKHIF